MTTNTFLFCAVHSNKLTEPFLGLNTLSYTDIGRHI